MARIDPASGHITAFETRRGELLASPIVDERGYWFIVHPRWGDRDVGVRAEHLSPANRGARDLGDCF